MAAGRAEEIAGLDEGRLDLGRAFTVDAELADRFGFGGVFCGRLMRRGGAAVGAGCRDGGKGKGNGNRGN